MTPKLTGVLTPLVTPFGADGQIDEKQLRAVVDRNIEGGVHGIVANGTSGEFQTLTNAERRFVVETVVDQAAGRVPVVAQTGALTTEEAIELTRHAQEVGADVAMVIAPYFDPLALDAVKAYYRAVAESVDIPVMLYNIPFVTGVNLQADTIRELAEQCPNIKYVKNTSADMAQSVQFIHELGDLVETIVGWDTLALACFVEGAGIMAITANVAPAQMVAVYNAVQNKDLDRARQLWNDLYPFVTGIDTEPFIAATKFCLESVGVPVGGTRISTAPISDSGKEFLSKLAAHALTLPGA
ncbi:dihydrodipicolinate synthase family protein [Paenarthrobacter sp. NPDC090520]|uniref:dihydrodipicolinate synthase family protein n=1 Tax=Paenarthrobacter sp. NPDC090520 TaxID=3364382 RepID=UPI00380A4048